MAASSDLMSLVACLRDDALATAGAVSFVTQKMSDLSGQLLGTAEVNAGAPRPPPEVTGMAPPAADADPMNTKSLSEDAREAGEVAAPRLLAPPCGAARTSESPGRGDPSPAFTRDVPCIRRRNHRASAFDEHEQADAGLDDWSGVGALAKLPPAGAAAPSAAVAWHGRFGSPRKAGAASAGDDGFWGVGSLLAHAMSSTLGSPRSPVTPQPRAPAAGPAQLDELDSIVAMMGAL